MCVNENVNGSLEREGELGPKPAFHALSGFGLLCNLVIIAGIAAICRPSSGPLLWILGALAGIRLVLWLVFRLLARRRREGVLTEEGFSVGRRTVRWKDIARVRRGVSPHIVLEYRALLTKWRRFLAAPARGIRLPADEWVLTRVLPEIARRRPDVPFTKAARRALENPGRILAIRRWPGVALVAAGVGVAGMPLLIRYGGSFGLIWAWLAVLAVIVPLLTWRGLFRSADEALAAEAMVLVWYPTLLWREAAFGHCPVYRTDAPLAMLAAFTAMAGVALLGKWKLTALQKGTVLLCILAAGSGTYLAGAARELPKTDITPLLGENQFAVPNVWSPDGRLGVHPLADGKEGQQHRVIDFPSLQSTALPLHEESQFVVGIARTCIVRRIGPRGCKRLYVYRFSDRREVLLSSAEGIRVSNAGCVRPDGQAVCWLEVPEQADPVMKVYDLASDATETVQTEWPGGADIDWHSCRWADDRTIAAHGYTPAETESGDLRGLHIVRFDLASGTSSYQPVGRSFAKWRVSPDANHAFATPHKGAEAEIHYLDLTSGRSVRVADGPLPIWWHGSKVAVRVVHDEAGRRSVLQFDVADAAETPLLEVAQDMRLVGLSRNRRAAVLARDSNRPPGLVSYFDVVEVATGRRKRVWVSALTALIAPISTASWDWQRVFPGYSMFTADERGFIYQSAVPSGREDVSLRTYLYSIPDNWLRE